MTEIRKYFGWIRASCAATSNYGFLVLMACLLLCLQGAAVAQTLETWNGSAGDGLWTTSKNWTPTTPGSLGPNGNYDVYIPHVNGASSTVLAANVSIVNLTIDPDAGLTITNLKGLTITGTSIINSGQLVIADVPGFSKGGSIDIDNVVTLTGIGETILNSSSPANVNIIGTGTLINQQTINGMGGGTIGVALQNQAPNGEITGGPTTSPLQITGSVRNSGKISGLGFSSVQFSLNTIQNAGGTIDGGGNSGQVLLYGVTIVGGTVGSASVLTALAGQDGGAILSGVTITGTYSVTSSTILGQSAFTTLEGTITNNGKIVVTSPEGGEPATLYVPAGGSTLLGLGQVTMSGAKASIIGRSTLAALQNNSPHLITGGNITNLKTLTNQSQISNSLNISVETLNNTGGTLNNAYTLTGGLVQNGTIIAPVNPGLTLTGGPILSGVTFTGGSQGIINVLNATLDGLTAPNAIQATMEINDNGKLTLEGTTDIDSGGEVLLNSFQAPVTLSIDGSVKLSGTGEVNTSTSPNNFIIGEAGKTNSLTIDVPVVSYQGTIGDGTTMNVTIGSPTTVTNGGYPLIFNVGSSHTFNNLGTLVEGDSTIEILGNFKNYNSTTNTLTGGTYTLGGILQFNNANLVTNAAKLNLTGNGQIVNQSGVNGLTNFNTTTSKGRFELSGEQSYETVGTYTNEGTSIISANSFFTVGGTSTNYNQQGSTAVTTVDGRISVPAGGLIDITGGTLQGAGQLYGDVSLGNAAGGEAATLIVGDSKKLSALVAMENNYTQLATGVMDVQIGGTTAGTQYSQLSVTGNVTLGGTLNVALINKFKAVAGEQFTIINAPSGVTGAFTTVKLPANFQVVYNPSSVVLNVQ